MLDLDKIKIVRGKRKSISIVILPSGSVEVRAPKYVPQFLINQFVKSKLNWIEERLAKLTNNPQIEKKLKDGEVFMYLGKEYALSVGNYLHIEIRNELLLFPVGLSKQGKEALKKWYIKQAKIEIEGQVKHYAEVLNASYKSVSFSDTRSKWGSCTHDNRLQFNWRLIMAPLLVSRYVVLHELVHTEEKNHSAIFWNKVRRINPSYKNQIKWLKENHNLLYF